MPTIRVMLVSWDMHKPVDTAEVDSVDHGMIKEFLGGMFESVEIHKEKYGPAVMLSNAGAHFHGMNVNARATAFLAAQGLYRPDWPYWAGNVMFAGVDEHKLLVDCPIWVASGLVMSEIGVQQNQARSPHADLLRPHA